ncbi:uncharacterized protein LOC125370070 [Ricinus communis]|uniref:uncharacterized protein LOC125370070 n=1 Tax=Ricinus communis TaxID=3988 RepID=UPI00201B1D64|nr:uncharacterized protein LOC125370070 [Ricinus communis]
MADSGQISTIVQAPRQLEKEDLQKLIPTEWVTNYEKLQASQAKPVQATDPLFVNQKDGTVKTIFTKTGESSSAPTIFQASMIQPVSRPREKISIHSFQSSGHQVYTAKVKGHFIWDVDPGMCQPGCTYEDDLDFAELCFQHSNKNSRVMTPDSPCSAMEPRPDDRDPDDPWMGIPQKQKQSKAPLPMFNEAINLLAKEGKTVLDISFDEMKELLAQLGIEFGKSPSATCRKEIQADLSVVQPPIQGCYMFQPEDFPPLGKMENKRSEILPSRITPSESIEPITPPEEVLNWQTSNSIVQNSYLKKIDGKLDQALHLAHKLDHKLDTFS